MFENYSFLVYLSLPVLKIAEATSFLESRA